MMFPQPGENLLESRSRPDDHMLSAKLVLSSTSGGRALAFLPVVRIYAAHSEFMSKLSDHSLQENRVRCEKRANSAPDKLYGLAGINALKELERRFRCSDCADWLV
jgi:hypothetical protein